MTSKCIQLFFLFFVNYINAFSQITSTEGFESNNFPPAGWSIKVNIPVPGTNIWIRQPAPTTNPVTSAHGGSVVSRFRSRNVAAGTKQYLISRPIDYTSRDTHSAKLEFYMYRDSLFKANVDSLTVWVSLLDSINVDAVKLGTIARNRGIAIPDTQSVNAWYHFSYDVPDTFKGAPIYFIFEGTSQTLVAGQGSNMYIDDVSFD
ncbi:MAG TPA: choice-of-anchor J domain-containing protein, partial [Saprospiraceae bacterium]|nr:choice-of-anchor J domain-containing protein [Saprospiraceae bacterium]